MEEYYLMWLSRLLLHQGNKARSLLQYFGSAEEIWKAKAENLRECPFLTPKLLQAILNNQEEEKLDGWIAELEEKAISFYSYYHPEFPSLLGEIYNPPLGIYVRGKLPEDEIDKVGVIGARRCSQYGASVAYHITKDLGRTNVIVVSGMARGIDSMAHKGIMDGNGKTIAVLGCGADVCYPAENRELMERIIDNGCVLTEYPPGTPAVSYHFPHRNRIISGLCKMIVVVEAGKKSGTLITADLALENGRDVFVVPGNVTSPLSVGTNNLLKQGCPAITESGDILFELGISYNKGERESYKKKIAENLSSEEKAVYGLIGETKPICAEEINHKLPQYTMQEVQYMLSLLEISGHIRKLRQAGYIREV